ncbi:OmcA/MtrC family decaheme c-type cytochrome [Shewanella phaeophyticola]|uniref:OmcA/MtrC family decaheme c-type cytochrome n=1 Tax=Shewanella phaeophyticola TaxID=2978345 RepID=A0ABT2P492_9GAMM|nr:OmcA/MtrC family decaheme c-type cytochrome [Shewanella sp. KJ10-1]MCT8987444.1 OmcA/MtrC family decaheme c-type cytochrome [Shewanella sp. KJ10-1]
MRKYNKTLLAAAFIAAFGLAGCGSDGSDGADGADGVNGVDGADGADGTNAGLTVTTVENAYDYNLTLDPADIVVVGSDPFSVKFTVTGVGTGSAEVPFSGLERVALYVTSQSANTTDTGAPMLWTNHALANDFGSSMYCNLTGSTTARDGSEVEACTLVEDAANPGTYTGTWTHDGNAPVVLTDGDANDLVRVMIRTYDVVDADGNDISDKILSTPLDFIPATGELAVSEKDSVSNAACIKCHSSLDGYADTDMRIANIDAHHNYQKVENCVACHNPAYAGGQDDEDVGFNANFNAMIHTIHAGHHIADSLTGEAAELFGEIGFPSELNECTACHDNGTQWNDNVYEEACVSCHVDVDLATGENHNGIVPSSDAVCSGCHGAGSLSPVEAHEVGLRDRVAEGLVFDFTSAVATATTDPLVSTLTVTANVTLNGEPIADDTDLSPYMTSTSRGYLIGNLSEDGAVTSGLGMSVLTDAVSMTGGVLTVASDFDASLLVGPIYVTAEVQVCAEDDMIVMCTTDDDGDIEQLAVANSAPVKYFNLTDADATEVISRFDDPARITVTEAKCNSCHGSLTYVKGTHGVTEFTQCMDCHNENVGRSGHPVQYKSVDADGNATWVTVDDVTFSQRDLFAVSHRFHSGLWDATRGEPAIYRDESGELFGYPAVETNCTECHNDGESLFADDGGLTSGKRAIKVSTTEELYISPVAEACRSCHAHSDAAALAHFKSNGATVEGTPDTTADLPVESCATCHAEGKTYGIDTVHSSVAH